MSEAVPVDAQAVLDHWFGPADSPEHGRVRDLWFRKSEATDRDIAQRFGPLIERALRGELAGWAAQPRTALAQIVLLDQFARNTLRDTPRAFDGDARALPAALAMVEARHDEALLPVQRAFVYLPFEHAERLDMQDKAVRLFTRLAAEAPDTREMLAFAVRHREVVQRFGRFPHRNTLLGRESTAEEVAFLSEPGSRF